MVKRKRSYAGQSKRLPSSLLVHTEPAPQHSWLARTVPLPAALFLAASAAIAGLGGSSDPPPPQSLNSTQRFPVPWATSESTSPHFGTIMKNRTHFAHRAEHIAGVADFAVALATYKAAANAGQRGHHLAVNARRIIVP